MPLISTKAVNIFQKGRTCLRLYRGVKTRTFSRFRSRVTIFRARSQFEEISALYTKISVTNKEQSGSGGSQLPLFRYLHGASNLSKIYLTSLQWYIGPETFLLISSWFLLWVLCFIIVLGIRRLDWPSWIDVLQLTTTMRHPLLFKSS